MYFHTASDRKEDRMTLRHIRIFVTVYQCESITKAAAKLHLAQPSVSLAISELEEYYGLRLFDRMARRIYITEAGRQFYSYALHISSLFDEMEKGMKKSGSTGTLRVGAGITIGSRLLPELLLRFRKQHPDFRVKALIKNYSAVEEALLSNQIDFALVEGSPSAPQFVDIPFMKDRLCLLCGPSHPLAKKDCVLPDELLPYDFLMRETGSATSEIVKSLCSLHGLKITPAWESASNEAIIEALKKNLGITILPRLVVQKDLLSGALKEVGLKNINLERIFSILYHKNKYLPEVAREFIAFCSVTAEELCRDDAVPEFPPG